MEHVLARVGLTAAFLVLPYLSFADPVTLTARNGNLKIEGELLNYDGATFRVASQYGVVTLNADAVSCKGASCPGPEGYVSDWMISGAEESTRALIPPLIEAFAADEGLGFVRQVEDPTHDLYVLIDVEAERTIARIRLRHTTAQEGFADLVAEQADMALALRLPDSDELILAEDAGLGPLGSLRQSRLAALDAIVAIAGRGSGMDHIALDDLGGVIMGRIARWSEIGGPDAPINLYLPAAGSGVDRAIQTRLGVAADGNLRRFASLEALREAVEADPFGLGLTLFSARGETRPLGLSGPCEHVVRPTRQALKSEDYPLTLPHYLHLPRWRLQPAAQNFLEFLEGGAAQAIIADAGFADQDIDAWPLTQQGERLIKAIRATGRDVGAPSLRKVVAVLRDSERLTPTFRFEGGSDRLDAPSRASIPVLVRAIRDGEMDENHLLIAGFTDGEGGPSGNAVLSLRRAEAVRDALIAALGPGDSERVPLEVHGFGEAMPLACDGGAWRGETNRRVEIWRIQR